MKHTNQLINETSPYLLQHAHNPVDWYPWGEEAFAKAEAENKPVFLSIGYSTCHWCHVMARESFESERVADILKEHFISVKVDREERPDLDNVYMRACQVTTGSGGWPMSLFLLPDKRPFFAGTYFPPNGFTKLLKTIAAKWKLERKTLLASADEIQCAMEQMDAPQDGPDTSAGSDASDAPEATLSHSLIRQARTHLQDTFDQQYGGFGSAPKFPAAHNLMFLLFTAPHLAEKTLLQMYKGGIFDHIGGGFCRYSTDDKWLVPHFEKMLYDNALLAIAYLLAYEKTGTDLYKTIAEKILLYMKRDLMSEGGVFYTAQDADTDGEEGGFYLFTPKEICRLLGHVTGKAFCARYDITEDGNYEGKNIPNLIGCDVTADALSMLLADPLNDCLPTIYEYRKNRGKLHTDTKILTGWNALAAAAFALAARVLNEDEYITDAGRILTFMEKELTDGDLPDGGALLSGSSAGKPIGPGFLDDYAFSIFALIQMHRTTGEGIYVSKACRLAGKAIDDFEDGERGGFFFSGAHNEQLIARVKESYDGALPSGNSVMYYDLTQLLQMLEDAGNIKNSECEKVSEDSKAANAQAAIGSPEDIARTIEKFKYSQQRLQRYMNGQAGRYPAGHCFYLFSLLEPKKVACEGGLCHPTDEPAL
ncbi:MAG: thioredoxin domain-containing protein [Bacillota bacterium]|nr:thioredoxin domain-containing protein [Bacillota bacterium]